MVSAELRVACGTITLLILFLRQLTIENLFMATKTMTLRDALNEASFLDPKYKPGHQIIVATPPPFAKKLKKGDVLTIVTDKPGEPDYGDGEYEKTKVEIRHTVFGSSVSFRTQAGSGIRDIRERPAGLGAVFAGRGGRGWLCRACGGAGRRCVSWRLGRCGAGQYVLARGGAGAHRAAPRPTASQRVVRGRAVTA